MKLLIGLGNPEDRYARTRHNVGFAMLDAFASSRGVTFQNKDKFRADIAEIHEGVEKILLVKPRTYYNNSGESARLLADFYKIAPEDVLVVHDELALPFGTIRTRQGGSDAGNNGVKSITQHLGPNTARIRIGIYNDLRDRIDDADFVLAAFPKSEDDALQAQKTVVHRIIDDFIAGDFEHTTHL